MVLTVEFYNSGVWYKYADLGRPPGLEGAVRVGDGLGIGVGLLRVFALVFILAELFGGEGDLALLEARVHEDLALTVAVGELLLDVIVALIADLKHRRIKNRNQMGRNEDWVLRPRAKMDLARLRTCLAMNFIPVLPPGKVEAKRQRRESS